MTKGTHSKRSTTNKANSKSAHIKKGPKSYGPFPGANESAKRGFLKLEYCVKKNTKTTTTTMSNAKIEQKNYKLISIEDLESLVATKSNLPSYKTNEDRINCPPKGASVDSKLFINFLINCNKTGDASISNVNNISFIDSLNSDNIYNLTNNDYNTTLEVSGDWVI